MGFQFPGATLRMAPAQMRPIPVPIGVGSRLPTGPVMVPMAPSTSIIGPGRLMPTQTLTQPTINGALPSRLSPAINPQGLTQGTTNGLNWNRPGVLIPGTTNVPTTPTITNPVTVNPGIPGRPIVPTTQYPTTQYPTTQFPQTPVYTQQPSSPSLWDRLLGGTTPQIAVTPQGVSVGLTSNQQAVQYTPQGTLVQPQTVAPGGRYYPTQQYQPQVTPGIGYQQAAMPNNSCHSYRNGFVGFFDSTMGAFLRKITGARENCWGGQVQPNMAPQTAVPGATTQSGTRVNPQFLTTPAMQAPGTVQNGVPITQQTPSVFQR